RFANYEKLNPNDRELRHLNARMAQIAASIVAVVGICDPKRQPELIKFFNRYAEDNQDPLLSAVNEALLGRTGDVPLTELSAQVNAILAREGEDAVHVKRITSVLRSRRYRIDKTNGVRVVRISSAARDASDANSGVGWGVSDARTQLQISTENKENKPKKRLKRRAYHTPKSASLESLASLIRIEDIPAPVNEAS